MRHFPTYTTSWLNPSKENAPFLERVCQRLKHAQFLVAAASGSNGTCYLGATKDLAVSTIIDDPAYADANLQIRQVPMLTLDEICARTGARGPILLKIDIDGREDDVVAGAANTLLMTEIVIVEIVFFNDRAQKVITALWQAGFSLYEILDPLMRPLDGAIFQVDMIFLKTNSALRSDRRFREKDLAIPKTWRENAIRALMTKT